jgi:recombination protein RecA
MSKDKEEMGLGLASYNEEDFAALKKEINKKHGANVIVNAQEISERERQLVSVSPVVDCAIGGIPEGSWVILSGTPKCGKTTTALRIAANAQRQYNKPIFYDNVEHRIEKKELCGTYGLNVSNIEIIQSQKGKILTAQDHLTECTNIIKSVPGCVLIIDSSSALCAEKEYSEDITAQARNEGPKLLATFCRKMASIVPVQESILIIIQHLIANTSGYGPSHYEDGGNKIQYQSDIKLRCTSFQKWELKAGDDASIVGQVVNWQVLNSPLGPRGKIQSYIRYGYGVDDIKEYITLGLDLGIIEKAGSWLSFNGNKVQGEEKMRTLLLENQDMLTALQSAVKMSIV